MKELEDGMLKNDVVKQTVQNNTYDNFRFSFTKELNDFIVENIEVKNDFMKLLANREALLFVDEILSEKVYEELRERE